ncbi:ISKra4 family transposase, partial [bacterium]|nr:ISKra4 family transposase [bacterium]
PGLPTFRAAYSPLTRIVSDNATPELRRLQAELGARHSFREAAHLLNKLTPCARQNHATIRNRLGSVAKALVEQSVEATAGTGNQSKPPEVTVFLDSAYVRSRPEYQRRNFEVIVRSIESETTQKRRFGLSQMGADHPVEHLRSSLKAAGWEDGVAVTVLSDGDPALPRLVRNATGADVRHILDWWHISVRIRHVETTFQTLMSHIETESGAETTALVETLRWRIWHGQTNRALDTLDVLFRFAMRVREYTYGKLEDAALSVASRAMELRTYLSHNLSAIANYGRRRKQGKAVSTSRAEGLVNEIANVRMGKKQRMRWSPRGAHNVAVVRAAVLDERLSPAILRVA